MGNNRYYYSNNKNQKGRPSDHKRTGGKNTTTGRARSASAKAGGKQKTSVKINPGKLILVILTSPLWISLLVILFALLLAYSIVCLVVSGLSFAFPVLCAGGSIVGIVLSVIFFTKGKIGFGFLWLLLLALLPVGYFLRKKCFILGKKSFAAAFMWIHELKSAFLARTGRA